MKSKSIAFAILLKVEGGCTECVHPPFLNFEKISVATVKSNSKHNQNFTPRIDKYSLPQTKINMIARNISAIFWKNLE